MVDKLSRLCPNLVHQEVFDKLQQSKFDVTGWYLYASMDEKCIKLFLIALTSTCTQLVMMKFFVTKRG